MLTHHLQAVEPYVFLFRFDPVTLGGSYQCEPNVTTHIRLLVTRFHIHARSLTIYLDQSLSAFVKRWPFCSHQCVCTVSLLSKCNVLLETARNYIKMPGSPELLHVQLMAMAKLEQHSATHHNI